MKTKCASILKVSSKIVLLARSATLFCWGVCAQLFFGVFPKCEYLFTFDKHCTWVLLVVVIAQGLCWFNIASFRFSLSRIGTFEFFKRVGRRQTWGSPRGIWHMVIRQKHSPSSATYFGATHVTPRTWTRHQTAKRYIFSEAVPSKKLRKKIPISLSGVGDHNTLALASSSIASAMTFVTCTVAQVILVSASTDGRSNRNDQRFLFRVNSLTFCCTESNQIKWSSRTTQWRKFRGISDSMTDGSSKMFAAQGQSFDQIVVMVEQNWEESNPMPGANSHFNIIDRVAVSLHYLTHAG